jgi:hypothetical protein
MTQRCHGDLGSRRHRLLRSTDLVVEDLDAGNLQIHSGLKG